MIEVDGRSIDYQEAGEGPAVLFVPGSFSTTAAWRAIQASLPAGYRFVSTSLCGYGGTDETRAADDFDIDHEIRVIDAVVARADAPVHLVGHSFGGTVAFAAALAGTVAVRSIATFEANPLCLLHARGQFALLDEVRAMSAAFEDALAAGERDAAARIIDYWGGRGTFAAMPEAVQNYCRLTAPANALDWHTDFGFDASPSDYARLEVPVLLVRGGDAIPGMVEMTDALADCLPNARAVVVEGAGHFLITSHAAACANLLAGFLDEVESGARR